MKNQLKLVVLSLVLVSVISCKKETKSKDAIVEEVTEIGLPNESDIYFDETITLLESNDHTKAALQLNKGIEALKTEGKELTGKAKETLDRSISQLKAIQKGLKSNQKIDVINLQEAMANAELAIGHDYLISDDVYLFTEPEKSKDHISQKEFRKNLKILESTLKNEDGNKSLDKDGSGQKLYDEGKELEKELETLMLKIKDHNKRANEHIKTHHPEHHYPTYQPYF